MSIFNDLERTDDTVSHWKSPEVGSFVGFLVGFHHSGGGPLGTRSLGFSRL